MTALYRSALPQLDGSFFLTDQEGFWNPKNRIDRVRPGEFHGNAQPGERTPQFV